MVFNIAVIIGIVVQGVIILCLAKHVYMLHYALASLIAYFQALTADLGYPKIIDLDGADMEELRKWTHSRKETSGDI